MLSQLCSVLWWEEYKCSFSAKNSQAPDRTYNWPFPGIHQGIYHVSFRRRVDLNRIPIGRVPGTKRTEIRGNILTLLFFRLQDSSTASGAIVAAREGTRRRRRHRRRFVRSVDERTRWSVTWRPTWSSSAAARGISHVTCARPSTLRTSACVGTSCADTTSICRQNLRCRSASLLNKFKRLDNRTPLFL